jgi:L-lactate dehydrogenase (cytochrome)
MGMINTFRETVQFQTLTTSPLERRLKKCVTVDDYRRIARRRLPRGVFDYIDGGAEDERTLERNVTAFSRLEWQPRVLRDVSNLDTSTTILGQSLSMPLILSPTGYTRIADSQGELAVARAAARAGIPYTLSTMGTRTIEEVAAEHPSNSWFQVYTWRDRSLVKDLIQRAAEAGYTALLLTVDTAVLGRRERDVRRGFSLPPKVGLGTLVDGAIHPSWTWDFLRHDPIMFANLADSSAPDGSKPVALAEKVATQFDQALSWDDIDWLRSIWDGPIGLKGIQTVADARQAVTAGVEAIGLSNHGGRQLDDAPTPIELVDPVRQEVQDEVTIICDGGVRRGADIVKALALGADAVSIGRPYLYALGAAGEAGVDQLLDFFREGLERTMALTGSRSIAEIDRGLVRWKDRRGD